MKSKPKYVFVLEKEDLGSAKNYIRRNFPKYKIRNKSLQTTLFKFIA